MPTARKPGPEKRPKHGVRELEAIIQLSERNGWRFVKSKTYFKGKCPCGAHLKTVHLTPSNPLYARQLKGWFQRVECWQGRE